MNRWYLRGKVIHGFGRGGSQLGFPTANIELDDATTAALQKYKNLVIFGWGCVEPSSPPASLSPAECGPFPFAMSVGHNPQFKNKDLSAEVYFLHKFKEDFYGSYVRILCLGVLREQSAFTTLEELIQTIEKDCTDTSEQLKKEEFKKLESDPFLHPSKEETLPAPYYKEL
ncbi:riboflavin kinase [Angomonas deanei]|uniref:riboflavin kinase n=1 Tax=Angomonas deanei TaxID=59799 RepID=S9VHJ6_9TRYP|nr:riboflavin kinase [Angomonas deanei]EPY38606.1 riboflavin kinase [Angomonas deanei]EPY40740.1 riboflavin kinase [Angomonas deanei]EPY41714.1 riboflavin kinase [Angomonas deanei]EPY42247.1 riboflavin kinase [Angomonas deanei]|eukprot:EPY38606.1 riboflavin kinase [Angomonas deanei]